MSIAVCRTFECLRWVFDLTLQRSKHGNRVDKLVVWGTVSLADEEGRLDDILGDREVQEGHEVRS